MKKNWGIPDERRPARRALTAAVLVAVLGTSAAFAEEEKAPPAAEAKSAPAAKPGATPGLKVARDEAKGENSKEKSGSKGDKDKKEKKGSGTTPSGRAEDARERLLAAANAVAKDPDGDPDPKIRAERRAARRAYMKAQLEARKSDKKETKLSPEQKAELKTKLDALAEARKKGSEKRISEQKAKLKKNYGESHLFRPIRNELRRHAWRVARLERAEDVAEATDRTDLVERSKKLLAEEETRHAARMTALVEIWKAAGKPKGDPLPAPGSKPGPASAKPGAPGAPPAAKAPVSPSVANSPAAPAAKPMEGK